MNQPSRTPTDPDLQAAAQRLVESIRAQGDTTQSSVNLQTVLSDDISRPAALEEVETGHMVEALASLEDDAYSPTVRAAVDALLRPGEALGASARARMVAGAERAVRWRHAAQEGKLPVALQARREAIGRTVAALAAAIGESDTTVVDIESGRRELLTLSPATVVNWIRDVDLGVDLALTALRRSLRAPAADSVYAARTEQVTKADADSFYAQVAALLQD